VDMVKEIEKKEKEKSYARRREDASSYGYFP